MNAPRTEIGKKLFANVSLPSEFQAEERVRDTLAEETQTWLRNLIDEIRSTQLVTLSPPGAIRECLQTGRSQSVSLTYLSESGVTSHSPSGRTDSRRRNLLATGTGSAGLVARDAVHWVVQEHRV